MRRSGRRRGNGSGGNPERPDFQTRRHGKRWPSPGENGSGGIAASRSWGQFRTPWPGGRMPDKCQAASSRDARVPRRCPSHPGAFFPAPPDLPATAKFILQIGGGPVECPSAIASWCNGSTADSGSVCHGSNPCEAANQARFSQRNGRWPGWKIRLRRFSPVLPGRLSLSLSAYGECFW